jgi:excinuclease UvrABC nuclease subunit
MKNKEQLLTHIQSLLPILSTYRLKGVATVTQEHKDTLTRVYSIINPRVQVQLTCQSCLIHYLNMIQRYYDKNRDFSTVEEVMTTDVDVLPNKIEEVTSEVNKAVKEKRFEAAAALRDKKKLLQKQLECSDKVEEQPID